MTLDFRRRDLIRKVANVGISLPFLSSLHARSNKSLKRGRVLFFYTALGQHADHWYPGKDVKLERLSNDIRGVKIGDLPTVSNIFGADFRKYFPIMNLLRGYDVVPSVNIRDHWSSKALTSDGRQDVLVETIDQVIARSSLNRSFRNAIPSFHLKIPGGSAGIENCYLSNKRTASGLVPVDPIDDPLLAFSSLSNMNISPTIFRTLKGAYGDIARNSALSAVDQKLVTAHYKSLLRLVERKEALAVPQAESEMSEAELAKYFAKLSVHAIKSNLTRVSVMQMNEAADNRSYSFLEGVDSQQFHNISHGMERPEILKKFLAIQKFHSKVLLHILDELNQPEFEDGSTTFLDNTLVVWVSEVGVRHNLKDYFNLHVSDDMPIATFGNIDSQLKTGYFLDFRSNVKKKYPNVYLEPGNARFSPPEKFCPPGSDVCEFSDDFPGVGRPYNEFLITLMLKMGVSPNEWESFNSSGKMGFGRYDFNVNRQYDVSNRRSTIPFIS